MSMGCCGCCSPEPMPSRLALRILSTLDAVSSLSSSSVAICARVAWACFVIGLTDNLVWTGRFPMVVSGAAMIEVRIGGGDARAAHTCARR